MPVNHEGTKLRKSENGPPRIWPKAKAAAEKLAAQKAPPLEVFSAFRLTQDPDASQFLAYDEVVYPKVARKVLEPFRKAELDSLWLAGFLDHAHRSRVRNMCAMAGQPQTQPVVTIKASVPAKAPASATIAESVDDEGRVINRKVIPVISDTGMALRMSRKAYKGLGGAGGLYLSDKGGRKRKNTLHIQPIFKAPELEQYFELSRLEHECAYRIQRVYRRHVVWMRWHAQWQNRLAAIKIQALIRGVVTRRFIALWYLKLERLVTQWQARIRRHLTQQRLKGVFRREAKAASKLQATVLMFLCKRRAARLKARVAAMAIQRLWRGALGRARADRLYLDLHVGMIQRLGRRYLAKKLYRRRRHECVDAVCRIQRAFRGFASRKLRNRLLHARELEYRRYNAQLLSAEENFLQAKLETTERRIMQTRIRERYGEVRDRYEAKVQEVEKLEADYMGFHRKKRCMSPRDYSAGWDRQYSDSIGQLRKDITQAKLDLILDIGLQRRRLEEELSHKDEQLHEMRAQCTLLGIWREEEYAHITDDEKRRRMDEEARARQQCVAAQRRKWGMRYFTQSGKPDKRRAPGRPWDPTVYAGPERDTFCPGTIDLLALQHPDTYLKPGSDEGLRTALSKLYLQCYLNEVQRSEAVMNPIFQVVQNALPPVMSHPDALATLPPSHANTAKLLHGTLPMPQPPHQPAHAADVAAGRELAVPRESSVGGEMLALPPPSDPPKNSRPLAPPQRPQSLVLLEEGGLVDSIKPKPTAESRVSLGEVKNASVASTLETRSMDGSVLSYYEAERERERERSLVGSSLSLSPSSGSSASLQSQINAKLKPQSTLVQYASSPRHLSHGYKSLHRRRIVTRQAVWPLKEAEDRVKPTYDEDLLRSRLQRKYGPSISKRYREPVAHVPWSLLDELEAERVKWASEKGRFDRHIRERMLAPLYGRGVRGSAAGAERDRREQALLDAQREEEEERQKRGYFVRPIDEATEDGAGRGEDMTHMSMEEGLESSVSVGENTEVESITNITTSTTGE